MWVDGEVSGGMSGPAPSGLLGLVLSGICCLAAGYCAMNFLGGCCLTNAKSPGCSRGAINAWLSGEG
jgi:hypothetical protein